jgi:uncharacterized protein (TIGR01244 family)
LDETRRRHGQERAVNPIRITDKLYVSGQPELEEFPPLAAQGFGAIINNRPDGEDGAPGSAAEEETAKAADLGYAHVPVAGLSFTEADVRRFGAAVEAAEGKVLAHCRSGMRSLMMHALSEALAGRMKASEIRAFGQKFGIDLSAAERWLAGHPGAGA